MLNKTFMYCCCCCRIRYIFRWKTVLSVSDVRKIIAITISFLLMLYFIFTAYATSNATLLAIYFIIAYFAIFLVVSAYYCFNYCFFILNNAMNDKRNSITPKLFKLNFFVTSGTFAKPIWSNRRSSENMAPNSSVDL